MNRLVGLLGVALMSICRLASAQVITFESNGLKYQTLTKSGVTVMFAHLPTRVHQYSIVEVAVSNGAAGPYVIRPEDFTYTRSDGVEMRATPARTVVDMLTQKGSGSDVVKLISQYEASVYGNRHFKSTNGYEQRRQSAMSMTATKLKAAAAASAVALVQTKLMPGESTDGAVFFVTDGKPMGPGRLVVRTNSDVFEFNASPE